MESYFAMKRDLRAIFWLLPIRWLKKMTAWQHIFFCFLFSWSHGDKRKRNRKIFERHVSKAKSKKDFTFSNCSWIGFRFGFWNENLSVRHRCWRLCRLRWLQQQEILFLENLIQGANLGKHIKCLSPPQSPIGIYFSSWFLRLVQFFFITRGICFWSLNCGGFWKERIPKKSRIQETEISQSNCIVWWTHLWQLGDKANTDCQLALSVLVAFPRNRLWGVRHHKWDVVTLQEVFSSKFTLKCPPFWHL